MAKQDDEKRSTKKASLIGHDPLAWIKTEENAEGERASSAEIEHASDAEAPAPESVSKAAGRAVTPKPEAAAVEIESKDLTTAGAAGGERHEETMEPVTVDLGDTLNIPDAAELHKQLKGLLERSQPVVLDASSIEAIDTAALQLLCAFYREAPKRGLEVTWREPSESLCRNAGYLGLGDALGLPQAKCVI